MRCVAGIDFSIRCPAMCIHEGDNWSPSNCSFYYLYGVKKWILNTKGLKSELHPSFDNQPQRLDWITTWFVGNLQGFKFPEVFIEDYSYSSQSSSTHILAEGCGILKNKIWKEDYKIGLLPVKQIKKFATSNGNSQKVAMCEAFANERSWLSEILSACPEGKSPLADLVDAYFIAKMGFTRGA